MDHAGTIAAWPLGSQSFISSVAETGGGGTRRADDQGFPDLPPGRGFTCRGGRLAGRGMVAGQIAENTVRRLMWTASGSSRAVSGGRNGLLQLSPAVPADIYEASGAALEKSRRPRRNPGTGTGLNNHCRSRQTCSESATRTPLEGWPRYT